MYCNYGLNFYKFAEICEHIYDKINTDTHKCIEFHSAYRNNYKEIKNNAFTKQRLQKPKPYVPKPKPQAPVVDEEGFTKVNNKKLTKKYKKH